MMIFTVVAIGFIGLFASLTLKNTTNGQSFATFIAVVTCILIVFQILPLFSEILTIVERISELISGQEFFIEEISKIIGIAYIGEIAQSLCIDCGQSAIGQKIEMASKVIVLYIGYPIILSLFEIVLNISRWG